jgi:CheY-like chemotaxis protein
MPEIEKASERAAGLCRQMLAYAGKTQFVESHVDMTALVDDVLHMLKSTLPQNVTIKPYLTGDIPHIKADASQIRQIVMNLIINASEAIGEAQGDIRVALTKTDITTGQQEKDHLGKVITPGSYLCLEVADTGCGMDDETKQRIFEPFYTTKFPGRGLGMSAVLGIVTSHKGALQLSSQPGQGTTFKVYLPVQIGESVVESNEKSVPADWQGSGTILLVEDEPQLVTVAKTLLETLGFSVIEASNGVEAIEQYRKNAAEITLVLTDIGMPLMDGYELIAELKKLDPALPIIASSGFGDEDVISRIPPGDIAGLISKPYSFDQLRDVLKGVVEGVPSLG